MLTHTTDQILLVNFSLVICTEIFFQLVLYMDT